MWREGLRMAPHLLRNRLIGSNPYKVLLALTRRCNLRCRHCHIWQSRQSEDWSLEDVSRFLRSNPFVRWMDLTGGEPSLHPQFPDIAQLIATAAPNLVFLHFPTNGWDTGRIMAGVTRMQQGRARIVVTVSLDGPEDLHDHIRGVPGSARRALHTFSVLDNAPGVDVYLGTTVTPDNLGQLGETLDWVRSELPAFDARQWHVNLMTQSSHYFDNQNVLGLTDEQATAALRTVAQLRPVPTTPFGVVETLFLQGLERFIQDGSSGVPCAALQASVFVDSDASVYPCHIRSDPLGSLHDHGMRLKSLLSTPGAKRLADELPGCHRCWTPCEAYHALLAHPVRGCFPPQA